MPEIVDGFAIRRMVGSCWVKNVNNLGYISGISCGRSSTKTPTSLYIQITKGVQTRFNKLSLPHYSTVVNTRLTSKLNLLNKSFTYFPHSLLMRLINNIYRLVIIKLIRRTAKR